MNSFEIVINELLLEKIYEKYHKKIYCYVYGLVQNKWDSEDIVSTVFIKVAKSNNGYTFCNDEKKFKNWIYTIAHNTSIDFFRKNNRVIPFEVENDLFNLEDEDNFTQIFLHDNFMKVKHLIKDLSEINQKIIYLRFYKNLKTREISEIIDMSENTVKTNLSRSLKKLKKGYFNIYSGFDSELIISGIGY